MEKNSQTAPAAYYMQGTADGARPGRFYVNVSNLPQRPKYEMCALALHEGIPGHHLQGSLAIANAGLPSFTRFIEDRRYEFCPARRQLYAACKDLFFPLFSPRDAALPEPASLTRFHWP